MQLLTELLVVLDNMECPCKLKNKCNKMKKRKVKLYVAIYGS